MFVNNQNAMTIIVSNFIDIWYIVDTIYYIV